MAVIKSFNENSNEPENYPLIKCARAVSVAASACLNPQSANAWKDKPLPHPAYASARQLPDNPRDNLEHSPPQQKTGPSNHRRLNDYCDVSPIFHVHFLSKPLRNELTTAWQTRVQTENLELGQKS